MQSSAKAGISFFISSKSKYSLKGCPFSSSNFFISLVGLHLISTTRLLKPESLTYDGGIAGICSMLPMIRNVQYNLAVNDFLYLGLTVVVSRSEEHTSELQSRFDI